MRWGLLLLGFLVGLIVYWAMALQPRMRELERKMTLPEFQGSVHLKAMQFSLDLLRRQRIKVRRRILFLAGVLGIWGIQKLLR